MKPLVEVSGLTKRFAREGRPALLNVSLRVGAGEVLGVVGPNGAGKTTLFGCLLGLLDFQGEVRLHGLDPHDAEARRGCGYVPERLTFDPWMRASDFVGFHHRLSGEPEELTDTAVNAAMEKVGLPWSERSRRVSKFSRGNLQRLALAQAIVAGPDILFLDEPTSGMDPLGVMGFKDIVRGLAKGGCAVVFNSHQLAQVQDLCHRVVFLDSGRVASEQALEPQMKDYSLYLEWVGTAEEGSKLSALSEKLGAGLLEMEETSAVVQVAGREQAAEFLAQAQGLGVRICEARRAGPDLETSFKRIFRRRS